MSFLSASQIQAQVKSIRKAQKNGPQNFAIQYAGEWTGGEYLVVDEVKHLVCPCVSDLQIRESLLRAEEQKRPAILLCSMRAEQLGDDVIDRLAKRRVFAPKERDMLAELFSVASNKIDPRLIKTKPLMNALLEMVPPQGYSPVASGMLDLQTAWLTYLEQLTGEKPESLSLTVLLEWSLDAKIRQRLQEIQAELKGELVD
jgi:hypothetical protein